MPLTALDIFKHLPKTNCGECGVPTCLAFAMQLAAMKTKLEACPYVSEDAKALLASAAEPPIRLVKLGAPENQVEIGDETVLFRHEKRFNHPTAYALVVRDDLPEDALRERIALANQYRIERVGQELKLDMLAVRSVSRDANAFTRAVQLAKELTNLPLILIAEEPALLAAGAELVTERKPLLFGANSENIAEMVAVAKEAACALVLSAEKLDQLAELAEKAKAAGLRELVLHPAARELHESLETFTRIRRLAVKKNFRPLGYPTLAVIDTADSAEALVQASICTMKYCSVVVFEDVSWDILLPLFALRQNIFTDPQKPIQVKPGVYEIGTPNENSPLLVTTNFSLTYFTVAGDIEKSKMPAWLLVADTEGLSVMTAFAADKFTPDCVKKLIDDTAIASRLSHRKLIIPGMVAPMTIKLKELTGFEILVGPRDSAGIPAFLEETWKL